MPPKAEERCLNWTLDEVRILLNVRAEAEIDNMITGTSRDAQVYEKIAKRLEEMGVHRSRRQITTKLKNIKLQFFKIKDKNNTSGEKRRVFPNYDLCHDIWGNRASANPVNIVASARSDAGEAEDVEGELEQEAEGESSAGDTVDEDSEPTASGVKRGHDDGVDIVADVDSEPDDKDKPSCSTSSGKKRKRSQTKTKLQSSLEMLSGSLFDHLDTANKQYQEDEERRTTQQRAWELDMQQRHEEAQRNLVQQMNAGQMEAMRMFMGAFQMMAGQTFPQGAQQAHRPQQPFTQTTPPRPFRPAPPHVSQQYPISQMSSGRPFSQPSSHQAFMKTPSTQSLPTPPPSIPTPPPSIPTPPPSLPTPPPRSFPTPLPRSFPTPPPQTFPSPPLQSFSPPQSQPSHLPTFAESCGAQGRQQDPCESFSEDASATRFVRPVPAPIPFPPQNRNVTPDFPDQKEEDFNITQL